MNFRKKSLRLLSSAAVVWTVLSGPLSIIDMSAYASALISEEDSSFYESCKSNGSFIHDDGSFKKYLKFEVTTKKGRAKTSSVTRQLDATFDVNDEYLKNSGLEAALSDFLRFVKIHFRDDVSKGESFIKTVTTATNKRKITPEELFQALLIKAAFGKGKDFSFIDSSYSTPLSESMDSLGETATLKKYLKQTFTNKIFIRQEEEPRQERRMSLRAQQGLLDSPRKNPSVLEEPQTPRKSTILELTKSNAKERERSSRERLSLGSTIDQLKSTIEEKDQELDGIRKESALLTAKLKEKEVELAKLSKLSESASKDKQEKLALEESLRESKSLTEKQSKSLSQYRKEVDTKSNEIQRLEEQISA
ncbi:MAG: hypothetical protein F9K49_04345, partial [Caedimonadaceae bacterium]